MVAVRWCEAEVRAFEWTNTFSNLIFAITAYVGWRLAKERGLPFEFVAAELLLIVVFVGSVLFHGTAGASWRAELLDELPMVLLAHAYLWSVRDIHPWTRPPLWGRTLFVGAGVPIVGAVTYVWWQNYAVFINTLTSWPVSVRWRGGEHTIILRTQVPVFPGGRHRVLRQ